MSWENNNNPWGKKKKPNIDLDEFGKIFNQGQNKFNNFINKDNRAGQPPKPFGFLILGVVALFIWLSTGFYIIQSYEEGVILRLGKFSRVAGEGLHYHLPAPFEKVLKVDILSINREEVGFRSSSSSSSNFFKNGDSKQINVPEESLMLTGDQNIVDILFEVQWKVRNAKSFLFNVRDKAGESTVKAASESAMREVIGRTPIVKILTLERESIQEEAKALVQKILDNYDQGIEIVRLQMLKSDPPEKVIDAFRDVQNAHKDKEREINKARAYRNDIIPRARGEAERVIQDANAYKGEVVLSASGEASRFISLYKEFKEAKDITKKRIYLDTMQSILKDADKVIIDNKSNVLPYLPLDKLKKVSDKKDGGN